MKKYIKQYIQTAFLLLWAGCIAGCTDEIDPVENHPSAPEGMVPLEVKLAQGYSPIFSRAAESNTHLEKQQIHNLPDGSTLRLIVLNRKNGESGSYGTTEAWEPETNKYITQANIAKELVYVVQSDADGEPFLYPCEVHDGVTLMSDGKIGKDGELVAGSVQQEPYYLPKGTQFYCMAISPAKKLTFTPDEYDNNVNKMMVAVNNQEELLSTNNHWTQTTYSEIQVPDNVKERATVALKPLMHTTARIRVTIKNGKNVTDLSPVDPILELDRVPTDPGKSWQGDLYDQTNTGADVGKHETPAYNLAIGDTIRSQIGNNILYNRMRVHNNHVKEWFVEESKDYWVKHIELMAETSILPMDARPTPMIIRLVVGVNLTPMQFHYQVRENFLPGHTYNYTATINLSDNDIYVASWQDNSWTVTVDPDQPTTTP